MPPSCILYPVSNIKELLSLGRCIPLKSNGGRVFWSNVLAGLRSVGVRRAEVVEMGDRSGEVGEWE